MIESLHITNFQSHRNSQFEFNKGVNVIIGPTDSGKSAVIRALRWLCYNKPFGSRFRSRWGGDTSVTVTTSDNQTISRKEDSSRAYYLNDLPPFKAFKTEVPKEIVDALNLNDVNLQMQHDSLFLISNTSGEVAQHFNKVAKLDKIDSAQSNVKRWLSSLKSSIDHKSVDLITAKQKLLEFEDIETLETEVEVLEQMENVYQSKVKSEKELSSLIVKVERVNSELEKQQSLLKLRKPLDTVLELIEERDAKQNEWKRLNKMYNDIKRNEEAIVESAKTASTLHKQYEKEFPNICPLCGTKVK